MDAIVAEDVTKTYRIGVGRARIREMLPWPADRWMQRMFPTWWARDTFNALEDVSFSVPSGASVGLLGHNGAGKTTMLKVAAGVTAPTRGKVHTVGRVAALIDVLVGFHPDLTGRENTYLLGAVYGFGRKDMKPRIGRILDFAEIDELADTPLKRYSTGMMARLGFGIIAALDMNVLLVDEVLSVGDASFQRKCVQWMKKFREDGGTLLFVSHNLALVRSMTERAIWLDHGRVMQEGTTDVVLSQYAAAMERRESQHRGRIGKASKAMVAEGLRRWGTGGAHVDEVHVEEPQNGYKRWKIAISYSAPEIDQGFFCIGFLDEAGRELGGALSPTLPLDSSQGSVDCIIDPLPFRSGVYFPVVAVVASDGTIQDRWSLDRAIVVDRDGGQGFVDDLGPVEISARWVAP